MKNIASNRLLYALLLLTITHASWAQQNDSIPKPIINSMGVDKLRKVEKAYKKSSPINAANEYEQLGDQFTREKKYTQANEYYQRALNIIESQKKPGNTSIILRKIATNDESLNKLNDAILNYERSSNATQDADLKELNTIDLKRIENKSTPTTQEKLIDKKIEVLKSDRNVNNKDQLIIAKEQKAEIALQNKNPEKAIEVLKEAKNETVSPKQQINLSNKVADIYAAMDSINEAILITQQNIQATNRREDPFLYNELVLKLAGYYHQSGEKEKSINYLKSELDSAYNNLNTNDILNITNLITSYLIADNKSAEALYYYQRLNSSLLAIIAKDSILFQSKLFEEIDQRIQVLESEKNTQTALYNKTLKYNIILIIVLLLTLLVIIGIIWSLRKLKRKNLQILLQSLRREMNPHFIFNALNSVNQFIATNNERDANKYLSQYATLMRQFMSNSNKDFIKLSEEVENIQNYLALEHLRFTQIFDYQITLDDQLDSNQIQVPNMILQPFIENAIWHGLRYKQQKGNLTVHFSQENQHILATITDDGIGIKRSKELKTKHQQTYQSRGLENIKERITTLNCIYNSEISFATSFLNNVNKEGTIVIVKWKNINYQANA